MDAVALLHGFMHEPQLPSASQSDPVQSEPEFLPPPLYGSLTSEQLPGSLPGSTARASSLPPPEVQGGIPIHTDEPGEEEADEERQGISEEEKRSMGEAMAKALGDMLHTPPKTPPLEAMAEPAGEEGTAAPPDSVEGWTCPVCTYQNPTMALSCEMCFHQREQQGHDQEAAAIIEALSQDSGVEDAPRDPWACSSCTFENPASFLACEVCGNPRPRVSPRSVGVSGLSAGPVLGLQYDGGAAPERPHLPSMPGTKLPTMPNTGSTGHTSSPVEVVSGFAVKEESVTEPEQNPAKKSGWFGLWK